MPDVRNIQFNDGTRVALNKPKGTLSINDGDGDASEILLDSVGAMRLAEALTGYVTETLGEENAEAIRNAAREIDKVEVMEGAKEAAGL